LPCRACTGAHEEGWLVRGIRRRVTSGPLLQRARKGESEAGWTDLRFDQGLQRHISREARTQIRLHHRAGRLVAGDIDKALPASGLLQ
jgi:hypothetical protein